MTSWKRRGAAMAATGALLLGACSSEGDEPTASAGSTPDAAATADTAPDSPAEDERPWPVPDWSTIDPSDAGLDPAALDAMAAEAEAAASNCLVVTKDGELVAEWYWNGWEPQSEQEIFSATKSISSTLVGIAADRGLLSLDEPASKYITEWQGTPSEDVTIRDLVSNDSGRFQDMATDYLRMAVQEPDKTQFSIDLEQQHEPGTQWVYNNAAIQTLDRVLEVATGMPTHQFATETLFEPIGMASTIAQDPAGNTLTFMGGQASCRDLARFGLLFLRGGEWDGEQVVSSEWVDEATRPSQSLNPNYGFLWWLFGPDGQRGSIAPSADPTAADTTSTTATSERPAGGFYAALGLGNQVVAVFPDSGVVVTRLGTQRGLGATEGGAQFTVGNVFTGVQAALGEEPVATDLGNAGVATGG